MRRVAQLPRGDVRGRATLALQPRRRGGKLQSAFTPPRCIERNDVLREPLTARGAIGDMPEIVRVLHLFFLAGAALYTCSAMRRHLPTNFCVYFAVTLR